MVVLAGVELLDELTSGVPAAGAASVRDELSTSYATLALIVLVAPMVLSLLVEAPLLILADRLPRAPLAAAGLALMACSALAAGLAPSPWTLALALAAYGPASGLACGIAQAALVDGAPEHRERRLTEWTIAGVLGDLAAPALMIAVTWAGLGWREAFFVTAAVLVLWALLVLARPLPPAADDAAGEPLHVSLLTGLRNARLVAWLAGVALCSLMDEILAAFAVLRVRERGGDAVAESTLLIACTVGSVLGLAATRRLLARVEPVTLLIWTSLACLISYGAWLAAPSPVATVVLFGMVGAFNAPLYPLALARAHHAAPGRSGLVTALGSIFAPFDVIAPVAIGIVADRFGVIAGLAVLSVQPLGILLLCAMRVGAVRADKGP